MLNVFTLANGRLFQHDIDSLEELRDLRPVWIDLDAPSPEEKLWVEQVYQFAFPTDAVDDDLEESARFYEEEGGALHIRCDFLVAHEEEPRTVRAAFVLNQPSASGRGEGVLFSIHQEDVPAFRLVRLRARRAVGLVENAKEVLLKLFDADAEYSADTLEGIYDELEKAGKADRVGFKELAAVGAEKARKVRIFRSTGEQVDA